VDVRSGSEIERPEQSDKVASAHAGIDGAVLAVSELLFLLFGLPFGDALYHDKPITAQHWLYLSIAILCAIGGPMWPTIRNKYASPRVASSVANAARDARVWIAVLLVFFLYMAAPDIYLRATKPIVASGPIGAMPVGAGSVDETIAQAAKNVTSERDEAIKSAARAAKERDDALRELENLRHQKVNVPPQRAQAPTPSEPINWENIINPWTTGDAQGTLFLGIGMMGLSHTLVDLTNSYIVSELTGERISLQISTAPGPQLAQLSEINQIPPRVRIELWAKLDPPLHGADLLAHWGRFRFRAEYSGVTHEQVFDEDYMRNFLSAFPAANIGPHITKKR